MLYANEHDCQFDFHSLVAASRPRCRTSRGVRPYDYRCRGDSRRRVDRTDGLQLGLERLRLYNPAGQPVRVVASTNVYGDIARQIGGDQVQVTSFIDDPSQDPHSYEASPQNQLALSKARVIIENGGGYDDFMDAHAAPAARHRRVVLNAVEISGRSRRGPGAQRARLVRLPVDDASWPAKLADALTQADPDGALRSGPTPPRSRPSWPPWRRRRLRSSHVRAAWA